MIDEINSPWNSLEVAKLCASLLTPIAVVLIGYFVQQQLADQNRSWQNQQRIVERRLHVYDDVRNELNRIYCFIEDVGSWKEDNPDTIIKDKRHVDQTMHSQRAVWANDTFQAYLQYMDSAFKTYQGVGTDAKIKTSDIQKEMGIPGWNKVWSDTLTGQRDPQHRRAYDRLINLMSRDLSLGSASGS